MVWRAKKSDSSGKAKDSKNSISMEILPDEKVILASHGQTILDALLENDIEIDHTCGGMGTCGTCRIFVQQGLEQFEARNEIEQDIAEDRQFTENERLSCQNLAKAGLVLKKPY